MKGLVWLGVHMQMESFFQVLMTKKYFFMIWPVLTKPYHGEPVMECKTSNGLTLTTMFLEVLSKMKKYACRILFMKMGYQVEWIRSYPDEKSSCMRGIFSRLQQKKSSFVTFWRIRWWHLFLGHQKSQQKSIFNVIQGSYFCWTQWCS